MFPVGITTMINEIMEDGICLVMKGYIRHMFAETENGEFRVGHESPDNDFAEEERTLYVNGTAHNAEKTVQRYNFLTDIQYVDGEEVEYEIIFGNEKIVFIKAGAGGSARGRENKYLNMARRIHDLIGATVICASNPDVPHEELDEQEIRRVASERGIERFELYLWGTSDGGYRNIFLAKRFSETMKWIGVNSSFITLADFEEKLHELPSVKKILVYGTEDDEYDVVFPILRTKEEENLKILFIEGADHCFSDMPYQFVQTIDLVCEE